MAPRATAAAPHVGTTDHRHEDYGQGEVKHPESDGRLKEHGGGTHGQGVAHGEDHRHENHGQGTVKDPEHDGRLKENRH